MILRPSAAHIWRHCAGYASLASALPDWALDDEDTEVREEGTACHWSAHQHTVQGARVPLDTIAPNGVAITEEMHDAHDMYFDAVRGWGVQQAYFELGVQCKRVHEQCQGTLDVGAYDPQANVIFIGDLKFGYRFVDVYDNWQLLCYAVGLQHKLGILTDVGLTFEFLIVQPRSYHRDGPVRRWRVSAVDVRAQINILHNAAERALAANPMCTINQGCNRCDGRSKCETLQAAGLDGVDLSYSATPHELPFAAAEDELRRMQRARAILDARVTGLEAQVMHGMRTGQASRHYAMEASIGRRAWKDEHARATIINVATLLGVSITEEKILTPTQAEKKLPAALVAANSQRPAGSMRLVPIETSRQHRALTKGK